MQNIDLGLVTAMDLHARRQWVAQCELNFERQFLPAFDLVLKEGAKILFLAGPSCSGKTTSTKKLQEHLRRFQKEVIMVSTDDFFLDADLAPKNTDGTPNYESFDFIDSDRLLSVVQAIAKGQSYRMPYFDFKTRRSIEPAESLCATGEEIVIVEGIHALNDKFIRECASLGAAGIYICPGEDLSLDGRILLERDDIRFLRRMVRDFKHRNTKAMETCQMWENVLLGEDLYISPFLKNADVFINSTFAYEPFVIRDQALALLKDLCHEGIFRFKAASLTQRLNRLFSLPSELVPQDSLLNEFLR